MSKRSKSTKTKKKRWIVIMVICIAIAAIAAFQLVGILYNYRKSSNDYQSLRELAVQTEEETAQEHDWYDGETIDFDALQAINPDLIAWIRFDDTDVIPIDYPIAYSGDNSTYLHADIYGAYSYAGTLFFEGAFEPLSTGKDIVYGHLMRNGSMFAALKKYVNDSSIYSDNAYFTIYTPELVIRYAIFSYFITPEGSQAYEYGFTKGSDAFAAHIDYLCGESLIAAEISAEVSVEVSADADIMMLSTCAAANSENRIIVCAQRVDAIQLTEPE